MIRILFPLAVLAATTGAAPPPQPALTPASPPVVAVTGDLGLVQQHLRALGSMSAAFVQTDRSGKSVSGTFLLKKPGRIRFQYEKGVPILVVADGSAFTFIDYSVKQVQRWPIKNSPMSILLDPDRDIARFARLVPGPDARSLAVEASDPKHPEYGRITLVFARDAAGPSGLVLGGWVIVDSQGNRTSVRLSDQRFNVAVPNNSFAWRDPRGGR